MALLGLVAFAGYQNRVRIGDMLTDARQSARESGTGPEKDNFLADIGQQLQAGWSGSGLAGAIGELVARFKDAGRGDAADSWVSTEANHPVNVSEMEAALGQETLNELALKTGLSKAELLLRLNAALPDVVNNMTPNGQLPTVDQEQTYV
jgi:uncharacterized protein YidB (DUF937 family)